MRTANQGFARLAMSILVAPILGAAVITSAGAADAYQPPRTSWGDPLIQGVYNSNTDVPFERPGELGEKAFYTGAEYQSRRRARAEAPENETTPGTTADVHYSTAEFGLDPDQNDLVKSLRTSIITLPADGRLPALRAEAQQRSTEAAAAQRARSYDSAQDRPLAERCVIWPHEGPPLRPVGYNSHVQIAQSKDHVVFMTEMIHDARVIPLARSQPDFGGLKRWQGNSWGRWEGNTLVIETTGVRDEVTPRGSSIPLGPGARIVEKITRTGPRSIRYEFLVSDPALWVSDWGGEFPMELTEDPMFEYACHEGNYGIANTLRGAREEERAAGKAK